MEENDYEKLKQLEDAFEKKDNLPQAEEIPRGPERDRQIENSAVKHLSECLCS
jgi:hypothetical protein